MAKKSVDDGKIYLGPSKMGSMKECPRCFWILANKHIKKMPEGITAGLPKGIDRTLKEHYDAHRGKLTPELVKENVPGVIYDDMEQVKKWRYYDGGLRYEVPGYEVVIRGAIDDVLFDDSVHKEGVFRTIDYKTKASEEKAGVLEDAIKYNGTQLDFYNLFFDEWGLKVDGRGFIANYYPVQVEHREVDRELQKTNVVPYVFGCIVHELKCDIQRAKDLALEAAKLVRGGMPPATVGCQYCDFIQQHARVLDAVRSRGEVAV